MFYLHPVLLFFIFSSSLIVDFFLFPFSQNEHACNSKLLLGSENRTGARARCSKLEDTKEIEIA